VRKIESPGPLGRSKVNRAKRKRPNVQARPLSDKIRLFLFLCFGLIALFADLVLFGRFLAALVRALFALSYSLVAAIVSILLAFFAELVFFMRLDTASVFTFLAFSFRLYATALARKEGAATNHQGDSKGQSRQRFW